MGETLKNNNSEAVQSDWDILTELASVSDEREPGASEAFKREEARHKANADEFYEQASREQIKKLASMGIRDSSDAGEYLHEIDSWKNQVERNAGAIDKGFDSEERGLVEYGENNGVNPITGERLDNSPFAPISDENGRKRWEEDFRRDQENNIIPGDIVTRAVTKLIEDESREDDDTKAGEEGIAPRSAEALEREAIDKWLSGNEGKIRDSVFYATLKRKIEREMSENEK